MALSSKGQRHHGYPKASSSAETTIHVPYKSPVHKSHSRTHLVGHNRAHQPRIPSYGKNLNKLGKTVQAPAGGEGTSTAKHHRRSHSHTPSTSPISPQHPGKRVNSNLSLARNVSTTSLKRNTSNLSQRRNLSKVALKEVESRERAGGVDSDVETLPSETKTRKKGQRQPAVRFDLDSESPDADWTEVSNSESPSKIKATDPSGHNSSEGYQKTSRESSTESIASSGGARDLASTADQVKEQISTLPSPPRSRPQQQQQQQQQPEQQRQSSSEVAAVARRSTTPTTEKPTSRSATPNPITSRLLRRHPPHNAPPKMSVISATSTNDTGSSRTLVQSPSPPPGGTPGSRQHVVSRFLPGSRGSSDAGTPPGEGSVSPVGRHFDADDIRRADHRDEEDDGSFGTSRPSSSLNETGNRHHRRLGTSSSSVHSASSSTQQKNNKSNSNSPAASSTPALPLPSRTQQKLWLQRASSTIEPNHSHTHTADTTHQTREGASNGHHDRGDDGGLFGPFGSGGSGGGGGANASDPRFQKESSDRARREYRNVRRTHHPILESIERLRRMGGKEGGRGGTAAAATGGGKKGQQVKSKKEKDKEKEGMMMKSEKKAAVATTDGEKQNMKLTENIIGGGGSGDEDDGYSNTSEDEAGMKMLMDVEEIERIKKRMWGL